MLHLFKNGNDLECIEGRIMALVSDFVVKYASV